MAPALALLQTSTTKAGGFFIGILAILAPLKATIIVVWLLIVLDIITGMIASYKKKEPITSKKFSRVLTKMLSYLILIIASFVADEFIFTYLETHWISRIIASAITIGELISIIENANVMVGGKFIKILKILIKNGLSKASLSESFELNDKDKKD